MRNNSFVAAILILVLLHIISPIDLIPDVILVVGWSCVLPVGIGSGAPAMVAGRKSHAYPGLFTQSSENTAPEGTEQSMQAQTRYTATRSIHARFPTRRPTHS